MTPDLDQLDVFFGDLTVNRAYLYARLPIEQTATGWSLAGSVRGPRCSRAETLPLTSPLEDQGPGPTLLARALVPDPCFWSPDLPAIYDVTVSVLRGSEILATVRRELGLRSFGVRGRNLVLEGKRIVLRGVRTSSTTSRTPGDWQAATAQYITADPAAEQLAEASQTGAMVIVEMASSAPNLSRRLRALAQAPAVAIAAITGSLPSDFKLANSAPNLLLAQMIEREDDLQRQPWARLALVAAESPALLVRAAAWDLPLVAVRPLRVPLPMAEARAACDTLQRDLAPYGQFAGYVV